MDGDFLHALLHDLQGPVGRVQMLGEMLVRRTGGLDDETRVLLNHIGASASSATGVLEALRRYAGIAELRFQRRQFDLALAVQAAAGHVDEQLRSSGGAVACGSLPEVSGDPTQLAVLFQELIANSLRFRSAETPRVEVALLSSEPESWTISVTDNSAGFGSSDPERIFRPFAKTPGRSRPGIGLAICRHIARLHGGDLSAVSRQGGAEFLLRLPK